MIKSKRYIIFSVQIIAAAVLTLIDQWIKKLAVTHLMGKEDIVLIKNFIGLSYAENTGAAFSAFSDSTMLLSIVTLVLLAGGVIFLLLGKIKGKILNTCAVLILAGGAGNLIDRFAQGYVVDYIKTLFIDFPVYNFADCLVCVGAFSLVIYLIYEIIRDTKAEKLKKQGGDNQNG